MSQEQPRRYQPDRDQPIKYGDVFKVHGDLASRTVAPIDGATMQSVENRVLGETRRGGPASATQAAARVNLRGGFVKPNQASDVASDEGTKVSARNVGGDRIITEKISGQVYVFKKSHGGSAIPTAETTTPVCLNDPASLTIGEALEAAAIAAGKKPIEQSDAAAIQGAEVRATGINEVLPGGVGAEAQSAAARNHSRAPTDRDKTTLSDVLVDASLKLLADKVVTGEDAERVIAAEVRNKPDMRATPGGVAASMAAAAKVNRKM